MQAYCLLSEHYVHSCFCRAEETAASVFVCHVQLSRELVSPNRHKLPCTSVLIVVPNIALSSLVDTHRNRWFQGTIAQHYSLP